MTGSHRPYLREAIDRALFGAGLGAARLTDGRIVLLTVDPFRAFVLTGEPADPVGEEDVDGVLPVRAVVFEVGDVTDALADARVELANARHNLRACAVAREELAAELEEALRHASRHRAQLDEAEAKAERRAERRAFTRLLRAREVAEGERQRQFDAAVLRELRRRAVLSGDLFVADNSTRTIAEALDQPVDAVSAAFQRLIAAEQVVVVRRRGAGGHGIPVAMDPGVGGIPGLVQVLRSVTAWASLGNAVGDADRFLIASIVHRMAAPKQSERCVCDGGHRDPSCAEHGCPICALKGGSGACCTRCGTYGAVEDDCFAECPGDGGECRRDGCAYRRWSEGTEGGEDA